MTTSLYGVGIVGTGIMGRRMLAALRQHPRFRVAALWDPDATALRTAQAAAVDARAAADLDDLVHDPAVDLVYVASPPAWHLRNVQTATVAGRACLCEKPLAADVLEGIALRDLVAASGLPFAVNFPFACSAASNRLIALVRDGRLGAVERASIHARFAQWPRPWQAGANPWLSGPAEGGFTREVLSHFVFLALRLFGPATVADVELVRDVGHTETALRARLVHATVTVQIDAAVAGDVADRNRFEIVGDRGRAALVDWSQLDFDGVMSERIDSTPSNLDGVVAMLEGRTDHGLATADEALAVVRCIEAMLSG